MLQPLDKRQVIALHRSAVLQRALSALVLSWATTASVIASVIEERLLDFDFVVCFLRQAVKALRDAGVILSNHASFNLVASYSLAYAGADGDIRIVSALFIFKVVAQICNDLQIRNVQFKAFHRQRSFQWLILLHSILANKYDLFPWVALDLLHISQKQLPHPLGCFNVLAVSPTRSHHASMFVTMSIIFSTTATFACIAFGAVLSSNEPKKRGRKPKEYAETELVADSNEPKKRGRKPDAADVGLTFDGNEQVDAIKTGEETVEIAAPNQERKKKRIEKSNLTQPKSESIKKVKGSGQKNKGKGKGTRTRIERPPISEFGIDAVNLAEQMKNNNN